MANKIETLRQVGLDEKEAKTYLAALEYGPTTMISLAKKSGIKRTSIYNFMNDLVARGFIVSTVSGKRTLYSAVSPKDLEKIAEKQITKVREMVPELMLLFDKSPQKPRIRFYEGVDGIKTVFNDTLTQPEGSEMIAITSFGAAYDVLGQKFYDDYVKRRVAKNISGRGIISSDKYTETRTSNNKKELRDAIIVNSKDLPISIEFNIYQNKIAFMSFGTEKLGIIIESQQIADTLRAFFNLAWKGLKKK